MDRRVLALRPARAGLGALGAIAGATAAGCYRPSFESCDYACGPAESCPSGLHCAAGRCVAEGQDPAACPAPADARVDAPLPARCVELGGPPPLVSNVDVCALEFQPTDIIDWSIVSGERREISNGELMSGAVPPPFLLPAVGQLDPTGIAISVLVVKDLVIDGDLEISGEQPLAIVAFGKVEIRGRIAFHDTEKQPCAVGSGGPGSSGNIVLGSSGGGGGGFGGAGGTGGPSGTPGQPQGTPELVPLRGGCPGGPGGGSTVAAGGFGGGAIQISARSISLFPGAILDVAGSAGDGGPAIAGSGGGGGGGGSGGALLLEAPSTLGQDSALLCIGGGGGGGGGGSVVAGTAGTRNGCQAVASGGGGAAGGGNGGAGATHSSEAGTGGMSQAPSGWGGGGGGIGRMFVRTSR
ncbi:MAG: hypothetical protein ACTHU0_23295 [Kofleriaceae bacterium]